MIHPGRLSRHGRARPRAALARLCLAAALLSLIAVAGCTPEVEAPTDAGVCWRMISPKGKRVEVRFPDPGANPYLAFAAMLMAGLDGIANKIHPGDAMDKNLYDLPPEELKQVPQVCGSLREALDSLGADHDFLLKGDVFSKDFIESYIELKWEEVYKFEHTPHPIEFQMYYSV